MGYATRLDETVEFLRKRAGKAPRLAIVLGSGLGDVVQSMDSVLELPFGQVPHFHEPTVTGHEGMLVVSNLQGRRCCVLRGRTHLYEGVPVQQVVFPVRSLGRWGVETFILTNAAGAVRASLQPGQLMLMSDHLNLLGDNPLSGPAREELGTRFPSMAGAYDGRLLELARRLGKHLGLELHEGVYAAVMGPSYETPAEVRMLRVLGADAVGMSTVPEVIALRQMNKSVLGISCITNKAASLSGPEPSHREVLQAARSTAGKLTALLLKLVAELA